MLKRALRGIAYHSMLPSVSYTHLDVYKRQQLEEILIRFRENKFDALLQTENPAELEKLNDQLEAIGHHIQLIKEEARAEKENTKEMVSDLSLIHI